MRTGFISALVCGVALNFFAPLRAHAGSATWSLNPADNAWNTATNWTPATVPNGASDIATFGVSNTTAVSVSGDPIQVSSIVFNPGASTFNITADPASASAMLTFSGAGITNNSGTTQNLLAAPTINGRAAFIEFLKSANAGKNILLTVSGSAQSGAFTGAHLDFHDSASAGSATIVANGALNGNEAGGGDVSFYTHSTAGKANITLNGAKTKPGFAFGGEANFFNSSSAGNATFVVNPGSGANGGAGTVTFTDLATAANSIFTLNGPITGSGEAGNVTFNYASTAANSVFTINGGTLVFYGFNFTEFIVSAGASTLINNGGTGAGALGGCTFFEDASTASQARLIANGGVDGGGGGDIEFLPGADGGEAQIEVYGNGHMDVGGPAPTGFTIGSLSGDGLVNLTSLDLAVGSNNFDTAFSGVIQEAAGSTGSSVTKTGTGTLTLSGASTYTGGTSVVSGELNIENTAGSGTGSGPVAVDGGTLGGRGIIGGPVTIGTGSGSGALLAPAEGGTAPMTLSLQGALTFKSDGTYRCVLSTKMMQADQVSALGVTIGSGAQFKLQTVRKKRLSVGQTFVVLSNTSGSPISGAFANLADGSILSSGNNHFQVSYEGGDGNDLALVVVP